MAQRIIDCNMHMLPTDLFSNEYVKNGFLYSCPQSFGFEAYMAPTPNGEHTQMVLEYPKGYEILNYVDGDYTLEAKLTAMDEAGVDAAMLRMPVWQEWLPLDICKIVNDQAAQMCKDAEGRLYFQAVLPPWGRKEDIAELERCIDMGAIGIQFAATYGNLFLDDEHFRPYMRVLNEKKIPAVVHHTPGQTAYANFKEYTVLRRELGRIHIQAAAVGRELYSDLFKECPDLKLAHTMFGGNWFALQNILTPHVSKKSEAMNRLPTDVTREDFQERLKNNIFFDMTHPMSWGKAQVECAVKVCGADHLLLGSSFPVFYEWIQKSVATVNGLDVTQEEKDLMLGGNAERIFNL